MTLPDCIMTTILVSMITVLLTYFLKRLYYWDGTSHTMLTLGFPCFTRVSLWKIAVWNKREGFRVIELSREWSAYLQDLLTGQWFSLVDCTERLFCKLNTACLLHYFVGNWSNKDQGKRLICLVYCNVTATQWIARQNTVEQEKLQQEMFVILNTLRNNSSLHCISSSRGALSCLYTAELLPELMIYSGLGYLF